jgi:hypothetical protein
LQFHSQNHRPWHLEGPASGGAGDIRFDVMLTGLLQ